METSEYYNDKGQADRQIERQTDGQIDIGREIDRQGQTYLDRYVDGLINIQICRDRYKQTYMDRWVDICICIWINSCIQIWLDCEDKQINSRLAGRQVDR